MTTELKKCVHPFEQLRISKWFMNNNGSFGGQVMNLLVNCLGCGGTGFLYEYRGNVSDQYLKPNSFMTRPHNGKCDHIDIKMEPERI